MHSSTITHVLLVMGMIGSEVLAADPKIKIGQTYPVTKTESGYQTITVHKGHDCFLPCVVSHKPNDKKTQWMVQDLRSQTLIPIGTDTDTGNAFKYSIDKPASNNWRLKIRNVQESDQGVYTCRIQLHGHSNVMDIRVIKVVETPRISDIETSSDMVVNEGEKVELRCAASGIPIPVIAWQLVSGGTLPTGGREYTAPFLLLPSASREHRGLYKCVALNQAGKDERVIRLTVRYHPKVTARTRVVYQVVGESRQLTCEAFGSPLPTAAQTTWFKDGVPLPNEHKYTFETFIGSNSVLIKLSVREINNEDFGQYRCYAENSEGFGESLVELKRSETPVSEYHKSSTGPIVRNNLHLITMCLLSIGVFETLLHL